MTMKPIVLPLTYQALAIEQEGQAVTLQEKQIPSLMDDEVLIRVDASSLNSMDAKMAQKNSWNLPAPYVLGFDVSGEVVLTGGTKNFKVGDQVFGGTLRAGGFAEYVVAKTMFLHHREGLSPLEAGTYGVAFMTAYEALMLEGNLRPGRGDTIYIAGGAGGVGHFAVQMAKLSGLTVIASAGKQASIQLLQRLGVDHVIDYRTEDVVARVLHETQGKGADYVFEPTYSASSYRQSALAVARGGRYIRVGTQTHMEQSGLPDLKHEVEQRGAQFLVGDQVRYGTQPPYQARALELLGGLGQAVKWYQAGLVKPAVTQTVPFDPAALQAALTDFARGLNNVGKVVVQGRLQSET